MPTARTQAPRSPRQKANTQTSGRRFRGIELGCAARTRGVNPTAQAVATMCFMCRPHARGEPQAPKTRPHRPREAPVPGHSSLNQRRAHTTCAQGGGPGALAPGLPPLSQRRQPCQPRRPKKFQDFLSGAGSSGWSRRPRERAGAVGGHRGTRMASIAWIAW